MIHPSPRLLHQGDTALTIEFGDAIDADLNALVLALDARLTAGGWPGVVETVPTYRSLTVHLDPVAVDPADLGQRLLALAREPPAPSPARAVWRVPVLYDGADLDAVAERHGIPAGEVIARHTAPTYRVAMLGFLPGYAYLGGLDPRLALSRRPSPRPTTPAGTVSIGGAQALVASIAAPSGWHLLGRTPVRSFSPARDPIFLFEPGDGVQFVAIPVERWDALDRAAAAGECVAERGGA